uniref:contractile injection system protein, VgrG/Pvc8 family n=1 Tax=Cellvibrio fontiphilus TaxID=1815559 RepID=UPI002B4BA595|nr:contractile injection system protein, VgrG/Pvc8 family [Cellvibrio fontiphilus]
MNNFSIADLKTPDYRIVVNGRDISSLVSNRITSLTHTDSRGMQSDTLQLDLQDTTNDLELPPLAASIFLAIGWKNSPLEEKGTYTVSELDYSGPPNKLSLTATSADLRGTSKSGLSAQKSRSFHQTTIGNIVEQIAKEHSLTPSISSNFKNLKIEHIDQTEESDIRFLTRLARINKAFLNIKSDRLLFVVQGVGTTVTGKRLPPVKLRIEECSNFSFRKQSRDEYTGVIAYWNDLKSAKRQQALYGTAENTRELTGTFANKDEALRAAQSELEQLKRSTKSLNLSLIHGRPEIETGYFLELSGFKEEIQEIEWEIASVTNIINDQGFVTHIEAEPLTAQTTEPAPE